jgi:hypothetical protein
MIAAVAYPKWVAREFAAMDFSVEEFASVVGPSLRDLDPSLCPPRAKALG